MLTMKKEGKKDELRYDLLIGLEELQTYSLYYSAHTSNGPTIHISSGVTTSSILLDK